MLYKQITDLKNGGIVNVILRLADNAFIPFDIQNVDYAEYLAWLAEGNTPLPADTP